MLPLCMLLQIGDQFGRTLLREMGIVITRHLIEPEAIELETRQPVLADVRDKLLRAKVIVVEREHAICGRRHKLTNKRRFGRILPQPVIGEAIRSRALPGML